MPSKIRKHAFCTRRSTEGLGVGEQKAAKQGGHPGGGDTWDDSWMISRDEMSSRRRHREREEHKCKAIGGHCKFSLSKTWRRGSFKCVKPSQSSCVCTHFPVYCRSQLAGKCLLCVHYVPAPCNRHMRKNKRREWQKLKYCEKRSVSCAGQLVLWEHQPQTMQLLLWERLQPPSLRQGGGEAGVPLSQCSFA